MDDGRSGAVDADGPITPTEGIFILQMAFRTAPIACRRAAVLLPLLGKTRLVQAWRSETFTVNHSERGGAQKYPPQF
jgi:hypothetical protein